MLILVNKSAFLSALRQDFPANNGILVRTFSMTNYLDSLNPAQKEAALHTKGPVLIIAGAGAGKTKTITHRIFHLIKAGADPRSILAITFTNKAAREMRDRVENMLTADPGLNRPISTHLYGDTGPFLGTFHSLGVKILREHYKEVGIKATFAIFDRGDCTRAIKKAMEKRGIDSKSFEPGKILGAISREKGNMQTAEAFGRSSDRGYYRELIASVWTEYEKILAEENALDFDDLLLRPAMLLKHNKTILEHYQKKWQYIHVDEYQDTNVVQYEFTKFLAAKHRNICVVGDIDQNIYSWRGADIKNILDFEKDYPEAKVVLLEQNYRSTQTILTVANRIIEKNKLRRKKNLFTKNTEGERIGLYTGYDENDEATFVAEKTAALIEAGVKPSEIAVLYRANFQSRVLEEAFLNKNLPYQVLGTRFFERKEIKDAVSYIRAALTPESYADWERITTAPPRGIGKVTLAKVVSGQEGALTPAVRKKITGLREFLRNISIKIESGKLSDAIKYILENSGLIGHWKDDGAEGEERIENLKELITFAARYDVETGKAAAEHFLTDVALASDQDEMEQKKEAVRLMTVHASKGLEFDVVFVTGLEEDLFPHKKASEETVGDSEAEEERRLFYVALTRAKKKVYLSYAGIRTIFGSRQVNVPSEFIFDIDEEFLMNEERVKEGGRIIYLD